MENNEILFDESKCNYCGRCEKSCPTSAWEGENAYIVSFGGLFGNTINKGEAFLPLIKSEEQLYHITDTAIQFFDDNGNAGERFNFTIDRIGRDKFKKEIEDAYNGGF